MMSKSARWRKGTDTLLVNATIRVYQHARVFRRPSKLLDRRLRAGRANWARVAFPHTEEFSDFISKDPGRVRRDAATYSLRGGGADFRRIFLSGPKSLERVAHRADGWRFGQKAGYAVLDQFRARYIGRNHGSATQHRLHYRQRKTLYSGGHHQDMV